MSETGTPNLDAMMLSELEAWYSEAVETPRLMAQKLFPDKTSHEQTSAFQLLKLYAHRSLEARRLRIRGQTNDALVQERYAERTYARLPEWARW